MKFIYQPIKPYGVGQGFGENVEFYKNLTKNWASPMLKGHNGIDTGAGNWQPCYASHSGWVDSISTEESRGLGVSITSNEPRFFKEVAGPHLYKTRYWHFAGINVKVGDKVQTGDLIGWCDSTGYSTGHHLHFELKPVILKNGQPVNVLQNNGYFGAVDPLPYMHDRFALNVKNTLKIAQEQMALLLEAAAVVTREPKFKGLISEALGKVANSLKSLIR